MRTYLNDKTDVKEYHLTDSESFTNRKTYLDAMIYYPVPFLEHNYSLSNSIKYNYY